MATIDASQSLGNPRFSEGRLAEIAATEGALAAWRQAVTTNADQAAAGVNGDFAVVLRTPNGRTFFAVDRFATHSLCYRVVDGDVRVASRADALADTDTPIDPQAIYDYLYFHVIPSPRTIYKGIFRLPPAHYGLLDNGQLTVAAYWSPAFNEQVDTPLEVLGAEFKKLLFNAVSETLDGSKPACFLSGGTDSSTVVGMAAQASASQVASYSIGFDAQGYDEMAFARIAARHFNTAHHEYYVTPTDLLRSIPLVAQHFDQPFGNSSALPAYYCAKMAREDGVHKLLAGDGGDELFGGNSRYAKQRIFGWYDHVPKLLRKQVLEPVLESRAADAFGLTRKGRSYVEQARTPMPDRLQMYNLIMRLGPHNVLTPQLMGQVDTAVPLQLEREVWQGASNCSALNRELCFDWRFTLADSDLPKVIGAANLASVGVGFPLLDERLLAFSLKLPTAYKLKDLQLRWFFKQSLRGFLPEAIIAKKKQGFGLPFGVWANAHTGLMALAADSLHGLTERGVVRAEFVESLLWHRLPEHPGYYGEMVWILMMLEQWMRKHAPDFKVLT